MGDNFQNRPGSWWHGLQYPKWHRRRWSAFFRKSGLRGRKPAWWWPTRRRTYSPDPQDVRKCWVGHVRATFGGSAGQKPKFCKPTRTAKNLGKIEKFRKIDFFLKVKNGSWRSPMTPRVVADTPGDLQKWFRSSLKKSIFRNFFNFSDFLWKVRFVAESF